jgi:multisubunit Na+/H+ antiporter MnhC subunit
MTAAKLFNIGPTQGRAISGLRFLGHAVTAAFVAIAHLNRGPPLVRKNIIDTFQSQRLDCN